jgi:hypothetical protein
MYCVTSKSILENIAAMEIQQILHILSGVALLIQDAQRMRCVILSSVVCSAVPYFSLPPQERHDFLKKHTDIKYVLIFSTTFS